MIYFIKCIQHELEQNKNQRQECAHDSDLV